MFWIFPLLCLIFMVAMMFMMFRRGGAGCLPFGRGARTGNGGETPAQILDRRYASGQITKEQYQAMRRDLNE
jgi:putative membrane protein